VAARQGLQLNGSVEATPQGLQMHSSNAANSLPQQHQNRATHGHWHLEKLLKGTQTQTTAGRIVEEHKL
jgi:hypothetical protein